MDNQSQYADVALSEQGGMGLFNNLTDNNIFRWSHECTPFGNDEVYNYPDFGAPDQQPTYPDTQTEEGLEAYYRTFHDASPSSSGMSVRDILDSEIDLTGNFETFPMPAIMSDDPTILSSFQSPPLSMSNSTGTSIDPFCLSPSVLSSAVIDPAVSILDLEPHSNYQENAHLSHPTQHVTKPIEITKNKHARNMQTKHTRPCDLKCVTPRSSSGLALTVIIAGKR
jgi:hypothetical protein